MGLDGGPVGLSRIDVLNGLQRASDGAGTAPDLEEEGGSIGIEELGFDKLGAGGVLRHVAVESYIALPNLRPQMGGGGIAVMVPDEIGIDFLVGVDIGIDEALVRGIAVARHRLGIRELGIFPSRHPPCRALTVALPVKLAAGIDESTHIEITAVEQETNHRIVVVKLGVAGDDDMGFGRGRRCRQC